MSEFTKLSKDNPLLFDCHKKIIPNRSNAEWLYEVATDMYEALEMFCGECCDYDLCETCNIGKSLKKAKGE